MSKPYIPLNLKELIADLELMANGKISPKAVESKYFSMDSLYDLPDAPNLMGGLGHYFDDGDLRDKDPTYKAMQDGELRKLIKLLKLGASKEDIEKISFLGES